MILPWSFPVWTEALADRDVSVSLGWPAVALFGSGVAAVGALWLILTKGPSMRFAGSILGGMWFVGATVAGALPLLLVALLAGPPESFVTLYQPLLLAEGLAMLGVGWLGGVAIAAHTSRESGGWSLSGAAAGTLLLWGAGMTGAGTVHGLWLIRLGDVPHLDVGALGTVHVGHTLDFRPGQPGDVAFAQFEEDGWTVQPMRFEAVAVGRTAASVLVRRQGVTLTQRVPVDVGADRGDPLFPLMVGNHWSYEEQRESDTQVLWFIHSHASAPGDRIELRVAAEDRAGPLHTFTLETTRIEPPAPPPAEGDPPPAPVPVRTTTTLYRWNGQVMEVQADGPPAPFLAPAGGSSWDGPDGSQLLTCTFAGIPSDSCGCAPRPVGAFGIPGPAICSAHREGGTVGALGAGLLAIMTAGLVILDPSGDETVTLVASGGRAEE